MCIMFPCVNIGCKCIWLTITPINQCRTDQNRRNRTQIGLSETKDFNPKYWVFLENPKSTMGLLSSFLVVQSQTRTLLVYFICLGRLPASGTVLDLFPPMEPLYLRDLWNKHPCVVFDSLRSSTEVSVCHETLLVAYLSLIPCMTMIRSLKRNWRPHVTETVQTWALWTKKCSCPWYHYFPVQDCCFLFPMWISNTGIHF